MRCLLGAYVERMGGAILGYARMLDTSYRRSLGPTSAGAVARGAFLAATVPLCVGTTVCVC